MSNYLGYTAVGSVVGAFVIHTLLMKGQTQKDREMFKGGDMNYTPDVNQREATKEQYKYNSRVKSQKQH